MDITDIVMSFVGIALTILLITFSSALAYSVFVLHMEPTKKIELELK